VRPPQPHCETVDPLHDLTGAREGTSGPWSWPGESPWFLGGSWTWNRGWSAVVGSQRLHEELGASVPTIVRPRAFRRMWRKSGPSNSHVVILEGRELPCARDRASFAPG
jgi:hypothetical protein